MINRINLILQAKNINARQFADEIGVQPSGVSHILSGRNNPSLDFMMKVMKRYPEINIQWLMFGKGEMFVSEGGTKENNDVKAGMERVSNVHVAEPVAEKKEPNKPVAAPAGQQDLFSFCNDEEPSQGGSPTVASPVAEPLRPQANVSVPTPWKAYEMETVYSPIETAAEPQRNGFEVSVQPEKPAMERVETRETVQESMDCRRPMKTKKINKILVFYDDHTFSEYFPE